MPSKSLYKNTVYNNTFKFGTPSKNITVFYQPVIYGQEYSSDQTKNNAIELYRSTTFKFPNAFIDSEDNGSKFSYYTPDYVIQVKDNIKSEYIILDAKYSETHVVKNYYFASLIFKYLFSINTVKKQDKILGLYVLCGKHNLNEDIIDAYDIANQLEFENTKPIACLVPLFENETCVGYQQIIKKLK